MRPTLEEIKKMNLNGFNIIPVYKEIYSDIKTPIQVLKNLKAKSKKVWLLESVSQEIWGRYSFIGFDPRCEIKCKDKMITITTDEGLSNTFRSDDPMNEIRKVIKEYKSPKLDAMWPNWTVFHRGSLRTLFIDHLFDGNITKLTKEQEKEIGILKWCGLLKKNSQGLK